MKTTDNVGKDMLGFLKDHYRAIEELHLVSGAMHLARIWWSTVWRLIFSFRPGLWKLLFKIHLHSSGFEERGVWKFGKELFCIVLTIPDPLGIWLWRIPGLFRKRRRLATGR